jgi:hypothetical protein
MKLYEERRLALCEKHGTKDEKTGNYKFEGDGFRLFSEELTELGKQTVEIPGEPVKLSELGAGSRISESDASLIEMFLTD